VFVLKVKEDQLFVQVYVHIRTSHQQFMCCPYFRSEEGKWNETACTLFESPHKHSSHRVTICPEDIHPSFPSTIQFAGTECASLYPHHKPHAAAFVLVFLENTLVLLRLLSSTVFCVEVWQLSETAEDVLYCFSLDISMLGLTLWANHRSGRSRWTKRN
jgi:hypothetical protein